MTQITRKKVDKFKGELVTVRFWTGRHEAMKTGKMIHTTPNWVVLELWPDRNILSIEIEEILAIEKFGAEVR